MIFNTFGDKSNPVILMHNGSFTTGMGLAHIADMLKDDYYVIIPTYDGHHEGGGEFTTRTRQAEKIYDYLLSENIKKIAVVQGASMGAEVAVEVVRLIYDGGKIEVGRCFFDGGPFFHFPAFFRKFMQLKFLGLIKPGTVKSDEQIEKMMGGRMIKWMTGGDATPYFNMMKDMDCTRYMTKKSVQNESDACYTFDMYDFPKKWQRKFVFSWSSDEPAAKSKKNIVKHAPYAIYKSAGKLGHCGLLVKKPERYARILRKLAGKGSSSEEAQSNTQLNTYSNPNVRINRPYTLEYIMSQKEHSDLKAEDKTVGCCESYHDISCKKWRLTVQLDTERLWFLSVFVSEDGRLDCFYLDEEAANDSHYKFMDETGIREKIYDEGDNDLYLHQILIRYAKQNGAGKVYQLLKPYFVSEYHYD